MNLLRIALALALVVLIGIPVLVRPPQADADPNARRVIIITPHNEQICHEFKVGFERWHLDRYGEPAQVEYVFPGGTSEIRRMLMAQFTARLEAGGTPGGDADLLFGGGSYEHGKIKEGVTVEIDGTPQTVSISVPVQMDPAVLASIYGKVKIGDTTLYDKDDDDEDADDGYWFGTALSAFGLVYNRDVLTRLGVDEPTGWDSMGDPRLDGWVVLVNPAQSGSVATAFQAVLEQRGWIEGWQVLRRAAANSRYFAARSLKVPTDVSQGNAAMGVCIDFLGRFEAQATQERDGRKIARVGYVDPPGETVVDPDPISMLRNAPHPEMAARFIEFCLSEPGQALWQFRRDDESDDDLGPRDFELRRMPIRRSMYADHGRRFIDQADPFAVARPAPHRDRNVRAFIAPLFAAMAMDNHESLREAWRAITTHPAYPKDDPGLVTASDVTDPDLRAMLEAFDAMPTIDGPDDQQFELHDVTHLGAVKAGWLRGGFKDAGLWPAEADPTELARRRWSAFYRTQYDRVRRGGGSDA